MKSSKQPKEKAEQAFIHGSINKSPSAGKKSSKTSGGTHQKRADIKSEDEKQRLSSAKMILQLFPVDKNIKKGLEKEGHNPFLELSLSPKKKISSVIKHLLNKWGSSSLAIGELMLFPFKVAVEDLTSCRKWTSSDIDIKAGDVHSILGSPEIFRLSYGWVCLQSNISRAEPNDAENINMEVSVNTKNDVDGASKELECYNENESVGMVAEHIMPSEPLHEVVLKNQDKVEGEQCNLNRMSIVESDIVAEVNSSVEPVKNEESRENNNGTLTTTLLWSDLSNISIGGLLSEASLLGKFNSEDPTSDKSRLLSQTNTSDTLDAFIENLKQSQASTGLSSNMPLSILDAESTCHSFAFSKQSSSNKGIPEIGQRAFSGLSGENSGSVLFKCPKDEVNGQATMGSNKTQDPKSDSVPSLLGVLNSENSLGLSSIKWNDSLGPFDLPFTPRQVIKDDSVSIGGFVR